MRDLVPGLALAVLVISGAATLQHFSQPRLDQVALERLRQPALRPICIDYLLRLRKLESDRRSSLRVRPPHFLWPQMTRL